MQQMIAGILSLLFATPGAAVDDGRGKPATPAEQYQALEKEFQEAAHALYLKAMSDDDRTEPLARMVKLSPRCLELAEKNPKDPIALDALLQVVVQEMWLLNNTSYPGRGKDNLEARAIAILLRDHVQSDKLGEACRRLSYGFGKDCETFLRTVLEKSPHRDVRGLACLRLAQFLNGRLHRLDLIREQPEMARRYEHYGDVKVPYGDTVAMKAKSELHEVRHLSVGRPAQEIEGPDQDGKQFRLSDYRGKVVLLYFWSQY